MAAPGEAELQVTFGPAATPTLAVAADYALDHAAGFELLGERTYQATFRLGAEDAPYGRAQDLVRMVSGWRTTRMEVNGSPPEPLPGAVDAALRPGVTAQRGPVPAGLLIRAAPPVPGCALYDREWAPESYAGPAPWGEEPLLEQIPDHVPEDWA